LVGAQRRASVAAAVPDIMLSARRDTRARILGNSLSAGRAIHVITFNVAIRRRK
jgi:hypothetical protein